MSDPTIAAAAGRRARRLRRAGRARRGDRGRVDRTSPTSRRLARRASRRSSPRAATSRAAGHGRRGRRARSTRSAASSDPHRAIDWLSTFPQVVLLALGERAVRFQDAARDARAVVYAGIQADPLVARGRGAPRRRDAGPAGPRPGRDERRDDRPRRLAGDVPDALRATASTPARRAPAPRRSSRPRSRSPTAASRSAARSAARSSRR